MSLPFPASGRARTPIKLVVVALLFPIFLALALPGTYLAAFHHPTPTHMKVAIIDSSPAAAGVQQALENEAGDALDVSLVPDVAAAEDAVKDMTLRAAYDPSTGELFTASAGSLLATQAVTSIFTEVVERTGGEQVTSLTVRDLAPLPADDRAGISLFFVGLAGIIAGFVAPTVLGVAVPGLRRRTELAVIGGVAVVSGVIGTYTAYVAFGALTTNIVGAGLMISAGALVAGLVQSGGMRLIGPAMSIVGLTLFVILGIPASGAAVPIDMIPQFFQFLHNGLPTSGALEGLRRVVYFDGQGVMRDISILVLWALIGIGLHWLSTLKTPKPGVAVPVAALEPTPGETLAPPSVDDATSLTPQLKETASA
ncbi:ABC transporter permease [Microbacterium sp. RURRCA19A]|uniref:ABC transporter permease n=1 Tax=Microbacterium sp. RURRCA19A TaxID=1907391 RepID=UPI0009550D27|nr:ABC transporter permease [Microbacterium sp. RURRCA19A]SIR73166.1 Protein of unknown function [Microbacterium sp. RURRCA19A]